MRWFRHCTHVCQNCVFSDNKRGKRIHHWWLESLYVKPKEPRKIRGKWHIFCKKKSKLLSWDRYKRCFIPKTWVIKNNIQTNRNAVLKKHYRIIYNIQWKRELARLDKIFRLLRIGIGG